MTITILGLGGSLRPGSVTTLVLGIALQGAKAAGASTQLLELASEMFATHWPQSK